MSSAGDVLERLAAVNVGLSTFAEALEAQGAPVIDVDWRPPVEPDEETLGALVRLWGEYGERVAEANTAVFERIEAAQPRAVGVSRAGAEISFLDGRALLHSGPPIVPGRICDPQWRALVAACLFEGWASDRDEAARLLSGGEVVLAPGNDHLHVGPMTGVCSPSMPVWVVEDEQSGTRAFSTLNEGPGNTLWYGVGDDESIERLCFFRDELGPVLGRLIASCGAIDILSLAAQGLQMGDDLHMRSQATRNLLIRTLLPGLVELGAEAERSARFVADNHHFFLNLTMAAAKCASLAAAGSEGSTVVNLIARNGTDVGVELAGLPGRWFTAPAPFVEHALLREGYSEADGAPDIGDSAVIECIGLGGAAVAAAPVVATFSGQSAADAVENTREAAEICAGRSRRFTIPALDFVGTPVGIDARLTVELGITPRISTGVLHASSGAGQIGAGVAVQPLAPFRDAVVSLAEALGQG